MIAQTPTSVPLESSRVKLEIGGDTYLTSPQIDFQRFELNIFK